MHLFWVWLPFFLPLAFSLVLLQLFPLRLHGLRRLVGFCVSIVPSWICKCWGAVGFLGWVHRGGCSRGRRSQSGNSPGTKLYDYFSFNIRKFQVQTSMKTFSFRLSRGGPLLNWPLLFVHWMFTLTCDAACWSGWFLSIMAIGVMPAARSASPWIKFVFY